LYISACSGRGGRKIGEGEREGREKKRGGRKRGEGVLSNISPSVPHG